MIYILDVLGNNIRSQELPAVCILMIYVDFCIIKRNQPEDVLMYVQPSGEVWYSVPWMLIMDHIWGSEILCDSVNDT